MSFLRNLNNLLNAHRMPATPRLDPDDLRKDPKPLTNHVYGLADTSLAAAKGDYRSKVRYLPYPWRAVYTLVQLENQVLNGGFHQFFTNTRGVFDSHLAEDVDLLGEQPHAAIIRAALETYHTHDYRSQWRNIGKSWEVFQQGYKDQRFEAQDEAFFGVGPDLSEVVGFSIKEKAALFTAER